MNTGSCFVARDEIWFIMRPNAAGDPMCSWGGAENGFEKASVGMSVGLFLARMQSSWVNHLPGLSPFMIAM